MVRPDLANGLIDFDGKAHATLQRPAIAIGPLVGERRQEIVDQITVRRMNFDHVEADPVGAFGGLGESRDLALDAGFIQRLGDYCGQDKATLEAL